MIKIQVACEVDYPRPVPAAAIRILTSLLNSEGVEAAEGTLIFTDDEFLNQLKKDFFKVDEFTDVIAFRINDYSEPVVEGEIYISLPRAQENAGIYNEPLAREVARLIIHGGLHLLGFEDQSESQRQIMHQKEESYLQELDWNELFTETGIG